MRYLVTGREMSLLDQNTSENFQMPPVVLMEQAAIAFTEQMLDKAEQKIPKRVLVVCGTGNNGGDGIAIARLLNQRGINAVIYCPEDGKQGERRTTELYELQKKIYQSYDYPVTDCISDGRTYDAVIDAVFGTGLSRMVSGRWQEVIEQMNRMSGWKIAVDIASGVSADTGEVMGTAFRAEDTISFSFGKLGQYLWPGADYCGRISIVPIGITEESFLGKKPQLAVLEEKDLSLLPPRKANSHKGTYGKLLVIAGSVNMAGAAVFTAKAAYRTGAGLVKIMTPEENRMIIQNQVPEAILCTYGRNPDSKQMVEELKWADAVVLGPGLGTGNAQRNILQQVLLNAAVPVVLDADALNLLAQEPQLLLHPHVEIIVTPHLGEMARLTGDAVSYLKTRLVNAAQEFARQYDVICILKDFHTVTAVPYGLCYLNLSGNHGMATAGSGDVLSGILGGLLVQGLEARTAAPLGVYLHGRAGDAAREQVGTYSMMAGDILAGICKVI